MADPRHRDDPPIFYLSPQTAAFKYHALLFEPVWMTKKLVFETYDDERKARQVEGETQVMLTRGIYGFHLVETRDKFCRRCNAEADAIEVKICIPVTIPLLSMDEPMVTSIRYQPATGPVAPIEGSE